MSDVTLYSFAEAPRHSFAEVSRKYHTIMVCYKPTSDAELAVLGTPCPVPVYHSIEFELWACGRKHVHKEGLRFIWCTTTLSSLFKKSFKLLLLCYQYC